MRPERIRHFGDGSGRPYLSAISEVGRGQFARFSAVPTASS